MSLVYRKLCVEPNQKNSKIYRKVLGKDIKNFCVDSRANTHYMIRFHSEISNDMISNLSYIENDSINEIIVRHMLKEKLGRASLKVSAFLMN